MQALFAGRGLELCRQWYLLVDCVKMVAGIEFRGVEEARLVPIARKVLPQPYCLVCGEILLGLVIPFFN